MDGHLALGCRSAGGRSRLGTVRFEGLARASRALPETNGAVRVLTSTLGPGFLGGDCLTRDVDVEAGAELIVAAQMATPIFAGARVSRSVTRASVARGAALYMPGEPLLIGPGAAHETTADLTVSGDGLAFVAEIAVLGNGARLRARTSASIDGRLAVRDACDLEGGADERALLTAIVVTAHAARRDMLAARYAVALAEREDVRGGIGGTDGSVVVRAGANGAWALEVLLDTLAAIARAS